MLELKKPEVTDISYISINQRGEKKAFEVTKKSPVGGILKDYANPIAELDARNKPGYKSRNSQHQDVVKNYDFAPTLSCLKKPEKKKISKIKALLILLTMIMGAILVWIPSEITGSLFGVSLIGYVINQFASSNLAVQH